MLRLLAYLLNKGIVTTKVIPDTLEEGLMGLPAVTFAPCISDCVACSDVCPTDVIVHVGQSVTVDRGACIGCGQCVALCPTRTIENDLSTVTFACDRQDLIMSAVPKVASAPGKENAIFQRSLAIRVVSTGCSACDLEVSALSNPIFDMERFGVSIVASPRFADALLITGPVPRAMHDALRSCYDAMATPKIVIACGTCAISGGIHKNSYADANGVEPILPVDVFIPGCAPHPWQMLRGILTAKKIAKRLSVDGIRQGRI